MFFSSDNWAGAHPRISQNLTLHSTGFAAAYGNSDLDRKVEHMFSEIFEREVAVYFVSTGTAANALAMTLFNRPGGVALCHEEAHIIADECGAPEYFSGGGRLLPIPGQFGRIDIAALERELDRFPADFLHAGQPTAVSITQASEVGTLYSVAAIAEVAAICRKHDIGLHMDGARFANALVSLGVTPADMTWRAGVDALSFGATKNGCWCAEALIVFDTDRAAQMPFLRKRAGQLFSKSRFVAAQFEAYLDDGFWLEMASHSNRRAAELSRIIGDSDIMRLAWQPDTNEVFSFIAESEARKLREKGARFGDWVLPRSLENGSADHEILVRFVTSFATTAENIDRFAGLVE